MKNTRQTIIASVKAARAAQIDYARGYDIGMDMVALEAFNSSIAYIEALRGRETIEMFETAINAPIKKLKESGILHMAMEALETVLTDMETLVSMNLNDEYDRENEIEYAAQIDELKSRRLIERLTAQESAMYREVA